MMSSSKEIDITFVRHGQTDYNLKKFTQGQASVPLNGTGMNQAILVGKSLSQNNFDIVYSSDLPRAHKTAEIIVQESNVMQRPAKIIKEVLLREMSHGIYEHHPSSVCREAAKAAGFSEADRRHFRPDGGENQDDVALRANKFLSKLFQMECEDKRKENSILVVSHGLILRELFKILFEKDTGEKQTLEERKDIIDKGTGPNTGISKFKVSLDLNKYDLISTKCLIFLSDAHLNF